jgi:hypothetical protein
MRKFLLSITTDAALELRLNCQSRKEYIITSLIKFNIGYQIRFADNY